MGMLSTKKHVISLSKVIVLVCCGVFFVCCFVLIKIFSTLSAQGSGISTWLPELLIRGAHYGL